MFKRNLSIVTLFLVFSSQPVLAEVYKCISSNGKVSYSEKRCQEGLLNKIKFTETKGISDADLYKCVPPSGAASYSKKRCQKGGFVKKNDRWKSVEQHEAELHQNLLNKIKFAETKGMSDADVTLLNSALKADYANLSDLNYSYEQWLQIWKLLKLRDASLDAVASEISIRYKTGEINIYEAEQFNLFKAKEIDKWFNERISEMKQIGTYVVAVMDERAKEEQRANEEERVKRAALEKKDMLRAARAAALNPLAVGQAVQACENYAKARSLYKNTFNFSIFIDLYTKKRYDGGWLVESTFTVKNAYNLEMKHNISCVVSNAGIVTEGVID